MTPPHPHRCMQVRLTVPCFLISLMNEVFLALALLGDVRQRCQVAIKAFLQITSWLLGWQQSDDELYSASSSLLPSSARWPNMPSQLETKRFFSAHFQPLCFHFGCQLEWEGHINHSDRLHGRSGDGNSDSLHLSPAPPAFFFQRSLHFLLCSLAFTLLYRCHLYELLYSRLLDTTLSSKVGGMGVAAAKAVTLLKEATGICCCLCPFQHRSFSILHTPLHLSPFSFHQTQQQSVFPSSQITVCFCEGNKNQYNTKQ